MKRDVYSQYVQCWGDIAVGEGSDVLLWLDQINRDGLFPLNDSTFTFFVAFKKQARNLPIHVIRPSNKAFKKTVIDKVVQDEDVQFHWALDIDKPEETEALLVENGKVWVTIRDFSLAAS